MHTYLYIIKCQVMIYAMEQNRERARAWRGRRWKSLSEERIGQRSAREGLRPGEELAEQRKAPTPRP